MVVLEKGELKVSVKKEAIFHSDRGSQYASTQYRSLLQEYGIQQSMSAKGNCYDNAACESFFASLKTELPIATQYHTHKEVMETIEEYIGFYNTKRSHSYNGYQSPIETELKTGEVAIGFASYDLGEMNLKGKYLKVSPEGNPVGLEIVFIDDNVASATIKAVENGAELIAPPTEKPWGQTVSYVHAIEGTLIEICSPVSEA